ncbi:MAG: T9SS type A sorting domain-containing protein, partial [Cryomorphaceae bacterium]
DNKKRTIYAGSAITRSNGSLRCPNNDTLFNAGILTLTNSSLIAGVTGVFRNLPGSVLNVARGVLTNVSVLIASDPTNLVVYTRTGNGNQEIKSTFDGYYDLSIEGNSLASEKRISSDITVLNDLKINGSTLIASDSFTLSVGGDIALSSSAVAAFDVFTNKANVVLNGGGPQVLNGRFQLDDLRIQKGGGTASLTGDTTFIHGTLDVASGSLSANGNMVLVSNDVGDARVGPVGGTIIGDVLVQRYIDAGETGWRFLCAPVSGATLADWNDDFITSGFPGSDFPSFSFTSIKGYQESVAGHQDSGFVEPQGIDDPIPTNSAFWVYSGDHISGTNPFMIDVSGPLITGDVDFSITYSNNTSLTADGWNLVSNPYASTINWESPNWTKDFVDDAVYVWNTDLGIYASFIAGLGVNGGSPLIASSQGFYVHANDLNPALIIRESCKSSANANFLRRGEDPVLRLTVQSVQSSMETALRFTDQATQDFDEDLDAYFLPVKESPSSIHTELGNSEYAINSIPTPSSDTIGIALRGTEKWLGLSFTKNQGMNPFCLAIYDAQSGEVQVLEGESGRVQLDSAGASNGRYSLIAASTSSGIQTPCSLSGIAASSQKHSLTAFVKDNRIYFNSSETVKGETIVVYDLLGKSAFKEQPLGDYISLPGHISSGIYILQVGSTKAQKILIPYE